MVRFHISRHQPPRAASREEAADRLPDTASCAVGSHSLLPVREWTDFFSLASRSFGDNVFVSDGEGVDKLRPIVPPSVRNLRFGVGNRTKRHNPFAWNTQLLTWLVRCDELLPAAGIDAVAYIRPDMTFLFDVARLVSRLQEIIVPFSEPVVLVPDTGAWGGLCDRMALANRAGARVYFRRLSTEPCWPNCDPDELLRTRDDNMNVERRLLGYLEEAQVRFGLFPTIGFLRCCDSERGHCFHSSCARYRIGNVTMEAKFSVEAMTAARNAFLLREDKARLHRCGVDPVVSDRLRGGLGGRLGVNSDARDVCLSPRPIDPWKYPIRVQREMYVELSERTYHW